MVLGSDFDLVRDIRFGSDGLHGVAAGYRYPTSLGGFVYLTSDGGLTWEEAETGDIPLVESAAVVSDDEGAAYYVAGEAFFAVGRFPDAP